MSTAPTNDDAPDETLDLGVRIMQSETTVFKSDQYFYERTEGTVDGERYDVVWRFRRATKANNTLWSLCSSKQEHLLEQAFTIRASNLIRN